jgi:acyl-CoA thioesterase II
MVPPPGHLHCPTVPSTNLGEILDLVRLDDDHYQALTPPGSNRSDIFGGQVASQALRAAGHTVADGHFPNSVHCYFLRRGRPDIPIDMFVERTRAGRTYTSRKVDARQDGKTIFSMLASFHAPEPGAEHELPMPRGARGPDDWDAESNGGLAWSVPFEMRNVPTNGLEVRYWARVTPFEAPPLLHACALLYVSDMRAGSPAIEAAGLRAYDRPSPPGAPPAQSGQEVNLGSLDHALWFHAVPRVDEWFFCEVRPLTVRDSRGLVMGTMHDVAGHHLATFVQEMFLKVL